jgi:hypothetical protein
LAQVQKQVFRLAQALVSAFQLAQLHRHHHRQ